MVDIIKKNISWGKGDLTIEYNKMARLATSSVLVSYGDTMVLSTIVVSDTANNDTDFLPLNVVYQERAYAAGLLPGGYGRREGKASELEIIVSRMLDRTVRASISKGFCKEVQIMCTVLSYDEDFDPSIAAFVGALTILELSPVPNHSILGAAKIGYVNEQFVLNPSISELADSALELVVAGTKDSILMVESQAQQLSEQKIIEAITFACESYSPIIDMIYSLAEEIYGSGNRNQNTDEDNNEDVTQLKHKIWEFVGKDIADVCLDTNKKSRDNKIKDIKSKIITQFVGENEEISENLVIALFKELYKQELRDMMFTHNRRIDGRNFTDIRKISTEISILPRTHGSALFTRGDTQSLGVITLGSIQEALYREGLGHTGREEFFLHYNFFPFSVGEISMPRSPARREIGHGRLAKCAIISVLPDKEQFPYTIRAVSEITESNGSSSMASVCSISMACMDAGIPILAPVSGIAMGLIYDKNRGVIILSDIMGEEDFHGDMDFKVAGTAQGITALQMDIKIDGISFTIIEQALLQAKEGRLKILDIMNNTIKSSKKELSKYAPKISTIKVDKSKIKNVIGPGGKNIKEICEVSKAKVDIADDGTVSIAAVTETSYQIAADMISNLVMEPEIGAVYSAKVEKILSSGAILSYLGGRQGFIHISKIVGRNSSGNIKDYLHEEMSVSVKLLGFERGKANFTMYNHEKE